MSVSSLGKRVFADVTELIFFRLNHPRLSWWALHPMAKVVIRDRRGEDMEQRRIRSCEGGGRDDSYSAQEHLQPPRVKKQGRALYFQLIEL